MRSFSVGFRAGRQHWGVPSANFIRFFEATPPLRDLSLWSIAGLLNEDLRFALLQISNTLEDLYIGYCDFEKADHTEEDAIDAVISQLNELRSLAVIVSECMTVKAIAKKRKHQEKGVLPALRLDYVEPFDPHDLVDALEETHWSRININQRGVDISSEIHERARQVAGRRDIRFTWTCGRLPPR